MTDQIGQNSANSSTLRRSWDELRSNTLRKTFPQLLLGVFYWSMVLGRHSDPQKPELWFVIPFAAGAVFYGIVIVRVFGMLPRTGLLRGFINFWLLFVAYTLWLGFTLPVHKRDMREWAGWVAVASGLVALIILVPL